MPCSEASASTCPDVSVAPRGHVCESRVLDRAGEGVARVRHARAVAGLGALVLVLVQLLATVEATGDVERLVLRADRRRVRSEVAGGSDREDPVARQRELPEGRLDALDRVEVAGRRRPASGAPDRRAARPRSRARRRSSRAMQGPSPPELTTATRAAPRPNGGRLGTTFDRGGTVPRWRAGPASRTRSARPGTATGRTSRSSPRTPSTSSSACSTTTGTRRASRSRSAPTSSGTATCPASARGSATATASTAATRRSEGHRFNPHKLLLDPYAKAITGSVDWRAANVLPYVPGSRRRPTSSRTTRTTRSRCRSAVVIDQAFDWEGDRPPRDPLGGHGHLRGARQGLHDAPSGRARGPPRHLRRPRLRGGARASAVARRHRGRAAARSTRSSPRASSSSADLSNYWGYSSIGFFAPHGAYAATGDRGEQVREFKGMVKALHRPASR